MDGVRKVKSEVKLVINVFVGVLELVIEVAESLDLEEMEILPELTHGFA